MTTTQTRFFDELAKLMTNAAGAAQGVRREIDTLVQSQMERMLNNMELVKREEFEAVKAMAPEGARGERRACRPGSRRSRRSSAASGASDSRAD